MRVRLLSFVAVFVVMAALAAPVSAGGWASVRLDGPPPPAFQEVPWSVGFMIKQHDMTPINVDRAFLSATHRVSGETLTADAVQEGEEGHYTVTATFPAAGEWKWSITPGPFAGTSFPALYVATGPDDPALATRTAAQLEGTHPVHIHSGTCAELGDVVFPLNDLGVAPLDDATPVAPPETAGSASAVPVLVSVTTIDTMLFSVLSADHAINVHLSADEIGTYVACGDIGGTMAGDDLVFGLQELNGSGLAGIAVIRGAGTQTAVTIFLFAVGTPSGTGTPTAASGTSATVKLVAGTDGDWHFEPARLEIAAGTTVTWTNETNIAHTVSGANLAFDDSGYLDPGQSFSQTFTEPGVYAYVCDPHPWMTGEIVVT